MYCKKCGHMLEPESRFCASCGNAIIQDRGEEDTKNRIFTDNTHSEASAVRSSTTSATNSASTTIYSTTTIKKQSKAVPILLIIVVIAASILLYNMFFTNKPLAIVEKFVNSINEKDLNTAITCMDPKYEMLYSATSNILSKFTGGIKINDLVDTFPALFEFAHQSGNPVDLEIKIEKVISQQIENNNAVITVLIYGKSIDENGVTSEERGESTFYLSKFNKGWRITEFN